MRTPLASPVEAFVSPLRVLILEERQHLRKLFRSILVNIGVKRIEEAADGIAGLEAIKAVNPDLVIVAWDLPLLNGAELVRIMRTSGVLVKPDLPVIMFASSANGRRIAEAKELGVNAYLILPVSAKTLLERMMSIGIPPRQPAIPDGKAVEASDDVFIV
jgi:PleD family two-component response regulator